MNPGALIANYPYLVALMLFGLGVYTVAARPNLLKKVIGVNIMQCGVFLFLVAMGNVRGARPPIIDIDRPGLIYANPLPSALILTGIVVSVSVTAFALGLIVKIQRHYGTINSALILEAQEEQES